LEDALDLVLKNISTLGVQKQLVAPTFVCQTPALIRLQVTPELRGHVLAEDVYAPQNVPSTSTTSVDGYALRCTSDFANEYPQTKQMIHSH
jgi:gephyrin